MATGDFDVYLKNIKILRINLTYRKVSVEGVNEDVLRNWLGGRGLGVYYFLKEVNPRINPLSDENKVMIFAGLLTGINGVPLPGRVTVVSKSPLSGRLAWSVCGGKFGAFLRMAGYLGVIIEGRSTKPVYVKILNEYAEVVDADNVWGKDVHETYELLKNEMLVKHHINDVSIMSIGPAGENLVKYASLIVEKSHAAGRMGFGAILGYKRLKAIVVHGSGRLRPADEQTFREVSKEIIRKLKSNEVLKELGEAGTLGMLVKRIGERGAIPAYNFQSCIRLNVNKVLQEYKSRIDTRESSKKYCWGCQIGCHKYVRARLGNLYYEGGGPEYWGGFVSLGTSLGITDIDFIIYAKGLCDKLGLDAISTGHVISNFIEICERKKIYNIKYGDKEVILDLIRKIAYREDIGNELAEGAEYLGRKYGYEVTTSKGLEIGLCDPDRAYGYSLALATSNRGDHNQTMLRDEILLGKLDPLDKSNKVDYVIHMQDLFAVLDSAVICAFASYALDFEDLAMLYRTAVGMDISPEELRIVGERIYSAERYYNYLALGYETDRLPSRFMLDMEDLLGEYYEKRGWSNGVPREETLRKLGIITETPRVFEKISAGVYERIRA